MNRTSTEPDEAEETSMTRREHEFDEFTKRLAGGVSRRHVLRLLGAGFAGAVGLTALERDSALATSKACAELCRQFTGSDRTSCLRACARCRGDVSRVCVGGTGSVCCATGDGCCNSDVGQICCPADWHCCIGRSRDLNCCPPDSECCGSTCCEPGRCCVSLIAPAATCCGPGETCCFDPDFSGGDVRCGTLDPATGNCVPLS